MSKGFYDHSKTALDGCTMAIDGILIRTRKPYKSEVKKIKSYYNRKGSFGIIVMAGSDVRGKFIFATANHGSSDP